MSSLGVRYPACGGRLHRCGKSGGASSGSDGGANSVHRLPSQLQLQTLAVPWQMLPMCQTVGLNRAYKVHCRSWPAQVA